MLAARKVKSSNEIPSGSSPKEEILSESSHAPEWWAVQGPESPGRPFIETANALATRVDMSGGEVSARQSCLSCFLRHRDEIATRLLAEWSCAAPHRSPTEDETPSAPTSRLPG